MQQIMYGYIYLTTNIINGRMYIGQHQGMRLDETYLGSGTALKKAIAKYGRSSFTVEVLEFCATHEELNQREFDIIESRKAVESADYYNMVPGGGNPPNCGNRDFRHTEESKQKAGAGIKKAWERAREENRPYIPDESRAIGLEKVAEYWTDDRRLERAELSRERRLGSTDHLWVDLEDMLATMTQSEIADVLGVDQSAVAQRVRTREIVVEKTDSYHEKIQRKREQSAKMAQEARRKQGDKTWAGYDLQEMYKTMTQKQIADVIGVSQVRVSQRLRQLGITRSG